jgi:hypothetical protein
VKRLQVQHFALPVQRCGNRAPTTENVPLAEPRVERIHVGHAVQARQTARGAKLPDATRATMKASMLAQDIINAGSAGIVL